MPLPVIQTPDPLPRKTKLNFLLTFIFIVEGRGGGSGVGAVVGDFPIQNCTFHLIYYVFNSYNFFPQQKSAGHVNEMQSKIINF